MYEWERWEVGSCEGTCVVEQASVTTFISSCHSNFNAPISNPIFFTAFNRDSSLPAPLHDNDKVLSPSYFREEREAQWDLAMEPDRNHIGAKPQSRLQKKAPSNLQLGSSSSSGSVPSRCPIPLLSPLILHPPPLPHTDDKEVLKTTENLKQGDNIISGSPTSSSSGWQHPATLSSSLVDPSSILSSFQTQCGLAHKPQ